ncbi:hypothetical protein AX16_003575 [Volvariella volvacea WC 439]|nr:hypothetical protein AX16_003575 [Volvariella volvacea WC 439]
MTSTTSDNANANITGSETSGLIPFVWEGKTYQTWYKVIGDLNNLGAGRRPLVAIHGGPGWTHHYMLPHKILHERYGIPVIFYDQVGNGQSTHVSDVPDTFWTPELWMGELDNLLKFLKVDKDFDLVGNSWGGMLAGQYAATYNPPGLKHLIIGNAPASVPLVNKGFQSILTQLPQDVQAVINNYEFSSSDPPPSLDAEEYKGAIAVFLQKHICGLNPWPEELLTSAGAGQANPAPHVATLGKYSLRALGNLEHWSIEPIAHQISCPTLLLSSPYDQIQEIAVAPWFFRLPKVKWVSLRDSRHFPHFEEPENYFRIVYEFLGYNF